MPGVAMLLDANEVDPKGAAEKHKIAKVVESGDITDPIIIEGI